jgi:formylmethanofuran dehydrogenase subunit E
MNIGSYSFDEFVALVRSFHGHAAPGVLIGGFMVDLALRNLPEGELFDAFCETPKCLPDAIQLLTPNTVGNGWLKVLNFGRYALSFYEKYEGVGIRVFLDPSKLESWSEIKNWFFKLKPKKEQNSQLLQDQIREAGFELYGLQHVEIQPQFLKKKDRGGFVICPLCGEAYPHDDGGICRACQGEAPYLESENLDQDITASPIPFRTVPVEQAVGQHALHDMTLIIPGESKGPAFKRGHTITAGDVCRLQQMGRQKLYVEEENQLGPEWVHEDEAALAFGAAMAGEGVTNTEAPSEGKVNFNAKLKGLLEVDERRLEMFNLVPGVMCATRQGFSMVSSGASLAGTRAIPLFLPRADFNKAMAVLSDGPLLSVLPLRKARVGILVTGTELFQGLIKDRFIPIISDKVEKLDSQVIKSLIVPDDRTAISKGIRELLDAGADLLVTTAGLSVDPDDVTRQGLIDAGTTDMLYGAPVLPGAMTLLARIGQAQVIGVPACALYFKTTSLDLFLPRLLAGIEITRHDLARLGSGAFCLDCKTCTFPKCPFGR